MILHLLLLVQEAGGLEKESRSWPSLHRHSCPEDGSYDGWASSRSEAEHLWHSQADWGYLEGVERELHDLCEDHGVASPSSYLSCSPHLSYCRASHIMMDFRALETRVRTESLRWACSCSAV